MRQEMKPVIMASGTGGATYVRLYSAKNDTITGQWYDKQFTLQTNSSGYVDTFLPKGLITLSSSVALDTQNLTSPYQKEIVIGDEEEIFFMPSNNVLYWYGYKGAIYQSLAIRPSGWGGTLGTPAVTEQASYLDAILKEKQGSLVWQNISLEDINNVNCIASMGSTGNNSGGSLMISTVSNLTTSNYAYSGSAGLPADWVTRLLSIDVSSINENRAIAFAISWSAAAYGVHINALWLE